MKNTRCYAKISIKNLLHNLDSISALLPEGCGIIPIVKANAYSHGAVKVAEKIKDKTLLFAVAEINEALQLRDSGIDNGILILGYTDPHFAPILAKNKITQTVTDKGYAEELSRYLVDDILDIHLKIDTGMHRYGFDASSDSAADEIDAVSKIPCLKICGAFSHLAESDELTSSFTDTQLSRFLDFTDKIKEKGIDLGVLHIANSGATLTRPDAHLMAVRPGIILYGAYPSSEVKERYLKEHPESPLLEVMTMCARVGQVHTIKKGETVGYSRAFMAERDMTLATVTAGYADGIPRSLSNKGEVMIKGERFKIVGNVCMDLFMVDITDAKSSIRSGDEVVLWGEDGISIDEYAEVSGDINYTFYTGVSERVTKIYE